VRKIDDAQLEFAIFRGCLGFGKINHLLRGCPPFSICDVLSDFDHRLESILAHIISRPSGLDQAASVQSSLPVKLGGLGVYRTSQISEAAFVASVAQSQNLAMAILGRRVSAVPQVLANDAISCLVAHNLNFGRTHQFSDLMKASDAQRILSSDIHQANLDFLMNSHSHRKLALLRGLSMQKANAWVQCAPIPGLGLRVPSVEFRMMLRRHLDLDVIPKSTKCRLCRGVMDTKGDHAFQCSMGPHRINRHNEVRDICYRLAVEAGISGVRREQKNLLVGSGSKPGDIVADRYHAGWAQTAFDCTVSCTLQPSSISDAAFNTGIVVERAHRRKLTKFEELCRIQNVKFVPLAWESTGGATDQVHSLIELWTNAAADRSGVPRSVVRAGFYSRIAIAIQSQNARFILDRISEPPSSFVL
jgi:hypothetical protein